MSLRVGWWESPGMAHLMRRRTYFTVMVPIMY